MPISRHRATRFRKRRPLDGGANSPPPVRRRVLLRRRQAKEIIHHWDQQITRLRQRVGELEEQNARLVVALAEAVEICDAAITPVPRPISLHIANVSHFLLSQSVSLRSQLRLRWRPSLFSTTLLSLTHRRKLKPIIGWPFEPVLDEGETSAAPTAAAPQVAQNTARCFSTMKSPKS